MERAAIETDRLRLRPFTEDDAPEVARMAGDREIADTTFSIPHPYSEQDARDWIATHAPRFEEGTLVNFAIELRGGGLVGAIGLALRAAHRTADLGYWIGREHWGEGYATEAARAVTRHGFASLGLRRVFAHHMTRNPASGRVMEKIGMRREGLLRAHIEKWGEPEDVAVWGILREELSGSDGR